MMRIVGMMSGTSLDGVDAVLAEYRVANSKQKEPKRRERQKAQSQQGQQGQQGQWTLLAHAEIPLPALLKQQLYRLNYPGRVANELHVAKVVEQQLTACYATAYRAVLEKSAVSPCSVDAVAAHGQTIRHEPNGDTPYSVQLLNGALLSHLTRQTVVCDFRSKDIAAGGQGAPLAPLFHRQLFGFSEPFAVVNIGGISNISLLNRHRCDGTGSISDTVSVNGFDCGMGNCLLDEWTTKHLGKPFDNNGEWARQGKVLPDLLARGLADDYFALPAPKSTGRDYFHLDWLQRHLQGNEAAVDVMRTLVRLTATAIADNVPSDVERVIVVGGGARNSLLIDDLTALLPRQTVVVSETLGIDPQHIEALGFALLGRATLLHQASDTPMITGSAHPVVLGAIYPHT